jgi:hypothetical protein
MYNRDKNNWKELTQKTKMITTIIIARKNLHKKQKMIAEMIITGE